MNVRTTIDIRKATRADAQAVWELRNDSIRSESKGYYSDDVIERCTEGDAPSEGFARFVEENLSVIEQRGTIVASGALDLATGKVDAVFVSPQHQRHGLGTKVLTFLEGQARQSGVEVLRVESTLNAQDFYRAAGFTGEEVSQYHSPSGFSMACVVMHKQLRRAV